MFSWSSECEHDFQLLKNAFVTSSILGYSSLVEELIWTQMPVHSG